jgi:type I restriction enzyme S subunit
MSAIQQLLTDHIDIWTAAEAEKKLGRGRASGNAASVYGIKKLRELILELAVRGKLVPQDASDEPASAFFQRIKTESATLLAAGKAKAGKTLAAITEDEKPFDLPKGWEWIRLGEIAETIRGVTYTKSDASDSPLPDYVPLLRGNNINRHLNFDNPVFVPKHLLNKDQFIRAGDIVIAMSSGSADLVGKAAQATDDFTGGFGAFCGVVRSKSVEVFDFLGFFFQTPLYRGQAAGHGKGIGINNLQKSSLQTLKIPLPPLSEQHRLVVKVDELMALCDQLEAQHSDAADAHEQLVSHLLGTLTQSQGAADFNTNWQRIAAHFDTLFTTEASIDTLKQTLLQLAVMGKLVPQDANDEPASELLKRIQAEKAKLIVEGKIKKNQSLPLIADDEKSYSLPLGWEWCRLQEITKLITDGKHGDCNNSPDSGYFFLSAKDIQNGKLLYENAREIVPTEFQEVHKRTALESGDICMVNTGATVGKMAIAPDHAFTGRTTFQKSVAVIKILRPFIDQNYITNFLIAEAPNLLRKSGGSAINNLLLGDLKMKLVPLPSTREQTAIAARVVELMAQCDQLKSRITDANQLKQKLADVLVEHAVIG